MGREGGWNGEVRWLAGRKSDEGVGRRIFWRDHFFFAQRVPLRESRDAAQAVALRLDAGRVDRRLGKHEVGRIGGCMLAQHVGASGNRSEEHTSELQSLMRISYAGFCLKKKQSNQ